MKKREIRKSKKNLKKEKQEDMENQKKGKNKEKKPQISICLTTKQPPSTLTTIMRPLHPFDHQSNKQHINRATSPLLKHGSHLRSPASVLNHQSLDGPPQHLTSNPLPPRSPCHTTSSSDHQTLLLNTWLSRPS